MARLHEYQAKALLRDGQIAVPAGAPADSGDAAHRIAASLDTPVVVKIQAWTTGRKAIGGVAFADTPPDTADSADRLLEIKVGNFPVEQVLVEEQIPIADELIVSLTIDDTARAPMILFSIAGGSGVEERAGAVHRLVCDPTNGPIRDEILARLERRSVARHHRWPRLDRCACLQ